MIKMTSVNFSISLCISALIGLIYFAGKCLFFLSLNISWNQDCNSQNFFNPFYLPPCAGGGTRTLDLGIVKPGVYHCATYSPLAEFLKTFYKKLLIKNLNGCALFTKI
jgi:hypothetical protein